MSDRSNNNRDFWNSAAGMGTLTSSIADGGTPDIKQVTSTVARRATATPASAPNVRRNHTSRNDKLPLLVMVIVAAILALAGAVLGLMA